MKKIAIIIVLNVMALDVWAADQLSPSLVKQDSLVQLVSRYYSDGDFARATAVNDPTDTLIVSPRLSYYKAMSWAALYNYPRAIEYFQKAVNADSTNVNYRFQYSRMLIQSGFLERAAGELSACTRMDSAYLPAWYQLGLLYAMQKNDVKREQEIFSYLVRHNPEDFMSLYYLGEALRRTELQDSGFACITKSVAINPQYYPSLVALANAYAGKKQYVPALEYYRKAREIRPHDKDLLTRMGECFRKSGAFNDAIACYKVVIEMDTTIDAVYAQMGYAYYSLGKYDSSVYYYNRAIALESDNADYYKNIALVYTKMDSVDAAVSMSKKFITSLHPENLSFARTSLASIYSSKKRSKDAIRMYKEQISEVYMELAAHYQSNGMRTEAIALYQHLQELEPANNDFQFRIAYLYEEMNNYKEAIQIYTKIMQSLRPEAQKHLRAMIEAIKKKEK